MELRHLRCFLAVAEELHFARAAERLHIDQSPLSRTIKALEDELDARLFVRTTRSTQLTHAGRLLLEHVPRIFTALEQARDSVKSASNGFHGQLRIALSAGATPSRLPALLAQCREEDPEVEVRLFEVPLAQQLKGLHDDLYDAGFSMADDAGDGIVLTPAWEDELMVAVPARHPANTNLAFFATLNRPVADDVRMRSLSFTVDNGAAVAARWYTRRDERPGSAVTYAHARDDRRQPRHVRRGDRRVRRGDRGAVLVS